MHTAPSDRQDGADTTSDGTVSFLPHRLNRQPVIVRGLTADELWITVGISAAAGVALGIALAWLTHSLAMAPTAVVVSIAGGVFVGGGILRRQKRGRPDTWLYRQVQWWLRQHAPSLASHLGASHLITRSGYWTTRRSRV
jgi:conjugative transfer region protein (TIGR03750 family)